MREKMSFLSHYELTQKDLTVIPYSKVNPELLRWKKLLHYSSNGSWK